MKRTTGIGVAGALALGALSLSALPGSAQAKANGAVKTVTNDGRTMAIAASAGSGSSGFAGSDAAAIEGSPAGSDRIGALRDPLAGRLAAPATPAAAESVIGADGRKLVTNTTAKPARMVALITFGGSQWCTGFLIGPKTLVTAGHCVYDTGVNQWYAVSQFKVYPGYDGSKAPAKRAPYGSCGADLSASNTGWTVNHSDEYDYGALRLTCTVGNQTGWFGWWAQSASLDGTQSKNHGYPGDKPNMTQWKSTDKIRVSEARRLFYGNDTFGGNSGSPIFMKRAAGSASCAGWCVMAVHAYGVYGTFPTNTWNHGTRVNQDVSNAFTAWLSL